MLLATTLVQKTNPVTRHARYRRAFIVAIVLALGLVLASLALLGVGRWLVVEDPLRPSRAIVVLSGHLPVRASEAARIYRQGFAPEVWLTRPTHPVEEEALGRLGIRYIGEETYNMEVLKRLEVPATAIRVLEEPVLNTQQEALLVARELKRAGGDSVIIVDSKAHTRRTRLIWHTLVGEHPQAIVRYTMEDPFDPDHWWRNTADVQAVSHEVLGLINVWTGFHVRPDRRH